MHIMRAFSASLHVYLVETKQGTIPQPAGGQARPVQSKTHRERSVLIVKTIEGGSEITDISTSTLSM